MKRILYVILVLAVVAGAYLAYVFYFKAEKVKSVWASIPKSAFAVMEAKNIAQELEVLQNAGTIQFLTNFQAIANLRSSLTFADSVLKKSVSGYSVLDLIGDKSAFLSLHFVDGEIEVMFMIDLQENDELFVQALKKEVSSINGLEIKKNKTSGKTYWEIDNVFQNIYVADLNGTCWFTFSEKLMLESLKNGTDQQLATLQEKYETDEVYDGSVRVFVDIEELSEGMGTVIDQSLIPYVNMLSYFADDAFLDFSFEENTFKLTGFTHVSSKDVSFLNSFKDQVPKDFRLANYISRNAVSFCYMGMDDGGLLLEEMGKDWYAHKKEIIEKRDLVFEEHGFDFVGFFNQVNQTIGYAINESEVGGYDRFLYVPVKDGEVAANNLTELASSLLKDGDTLNQVAFRDYQLVEMGMEDFPELLLGYYFQGYGTSCFTRIDDMIVFGNSMQALKLLIDEIENDHVWGYSVHYSRLMDEFFIASHFGVYFDMPRVLKSFEGILNEPGKGLVEKYKSIFEDMELMTIQFSTGNNNYYTDVALKIAGNNSSEVVEEQVVNHNVSISPIYQFDLGQVIISRPHIVKNHNTRTLETLVQDAAFNICLIDNKGKKLWSYQLDTAINSAVVQVDVYKNQKLQYLFTTQNKVYCIDRNGHDVANYPYSLPKGKKINTFSLVDYDKSKKYRAFLSDQTGNLFLFDIKGKALKRWDPLKHDMNTLANPCRHIRVRGKDYMLAIQKDGIVKVFARSGRMVKGFPLELDAEVVSDVFIKKGESGKNSVLYVLTATNELVGFNLSGELLFRKLIPLRDRDKSAVKLVSDAYKKEIVLCVNDDGQTKIFDTKLNEVATFATPISQDFKCQLYHVGSVTSYFVTDLKENKLMVFDETGKSVYAGKSIANSNEVGVLFRDGLDEINIYSTAGTKLNFVKVIKN